MSHLMADGKRLCGKPDGHTGKHYSVATMQREIERCRARRENPGQCTKKGCTQPRQRFTTGNYSVYCTPHAAKANAAWRRENPDKAFIKDQASHAKRRLQKLTEDFPEIAAAVAAHVGGPPR